MPELMIEPVGIDTDKRELARNRAALIEDPTKETIERWITSVNNYIDQQIERGAHELTLRLPGITASALCARYAVNQLAEAAHADQETVGNLRMLVTEFVANELEHALGLASTFPDGSDAPTLMKPELSLSFRCR